jgi:hypothetical protein
MFCQNVDLFLFRQISGTQPMVLIFFHIYHAGDNGHHEGKEHGYLKYVANNMFQNNHIEIRCLC